MSTMDGRAAGRLPFPCEDGSVSPGRRRPGHQRHRGAAVREIIPGPSPALMATERLRQFANAAAAAAVSITRGSYFDTSKRGGWTRWIVAGTC